MAKIIENYDDLIGKTPIFRAKKIEKALQLKYRLLLKLEMFNPTNSVKDRAALNMILRAEQEGKINKDTVIIEPTSGNTGIALGGVCASRGYKLILTMPESMSQERRDIHKAFGAELILTPAAEGMKGAINKAQELAAKYENSFIPSQFDNSANADAHYLTTGPEIWEQCDGNIDYFVAGVGTGGTITGASKYLKEQNSAIKIVAVEPESSAVLSGNPSGKHRIQGIGAGFIPSILNTNCYDEIVQISSELAEKTTLDLLKLEGLMCGISSGAALAAALKLNSENMEGKTVLVILPDSGQRYISTKVFEQ